MMSRSLLDFVTTGMLAALPAIGVTQRYCDSGVLGIFREPSLLRDRLARNVSSSIVFKMSLKGEMIGIGVPVSDSPAINFALGTW